MLNDQRAIIASTSRSYDDQEISDDHNQEDEQHIRDIHALTPPPPPPSAPSRARGRDTWETSSHRSSSLSVTSEATSAENFTTMSREFNALVLAGSTVGNHGSENDHNNLGRIREEEDMAEETNPLAIVPDNNPVLASPSGHGGAPAAAGGGGIQYSDQVSSVQRVKKAEVHTKINAWMNAKIAKLNNRFKREEAVINGWESEQVQKANSWMKKVERKLEEKRAKAVEKMQNDVAKAHRKAEERRASAEAKRGTKVARVVEISNLMKAVGRAPAKRSFF